jgi:hypothetical protein
MKLFEHIEEHTAGFAPFCFIQQALLLSAVLLSTYSVCLNLSHWRCGTEKMTSM